jgi:spoIIIJ-associated protein
MVAQKINDRDKKAVFIVDINNYQTKKLDEFKEGLNTSADRVRLFKEPVELSPMTSYERMIVHSTFSDDPEIKTESEGEGRFRRVVLKHVGSVESSEVEI